MTMKLHGTVGIHAEAKLSFTTARSKNIQHRIKLAPPKVFFQKLFMAGKMPIMILLKGNLLLVPGLSSTNPISGGEVNLTLPSQISHNFQKCPEKANSSDAFAEIFGIQAFLKPKLQAIS